VISKKIDLPLGLLTQGCHNAGVPSQSNRFAMQKKKPKKFQNVSFNNVDEFLEYLPADERKITMFLRQLVFDTLPECEEKLSFNVPFYKLRYTVCFIWPSAIAWGGVQQKGVRFGFAKGHLLQDDLGYLDKGNRKQVYWRDFFNTKDVDLDVLRSFLFEAAAVDERCYRLRKEKLRHR
jgi:hypothetical protein